MYLIIFYSICNKRVGGLCIFVKCKDGNLLLYITVNQLIAFVKRIKIQ